MLNALLVESVDKSGQAYKSGIERDDILISYNGTPLVTTEILINLASQAINEKNEIALIRGNSYQTILAGKGALGISVISRQLSDERLSIAEVEQHNNKLNAERAERIKGMTITTTPQLEGYRVTQTLDIITAEYVGGMNIFRDILVEVRDIVGGRSGTLQNELRKARKICMANLKAEADDLGANAVIGVDLDYSEISGDGIGGGKSMLLLVASGTAVIVEKI